MSILITGSAGFLGKNLIAQLQNMGHKDIFAYDVDTDPALLDVYAAQCDFVFHLAGVNRPEDPAEFVAGNVVFTEALLNALWAHGNRATILATSSVQALLDNPYGRSKKAGEELLLAYGKETGAAVLVYRLPGVFGKWCRPGYNSVVATFCHNIARGLPIQVNDPQAELRLVYIDDVIAALLAAMDGKVMLEGEFAAVQPVHSVKLGALAELLERFRDSRTTLTVPDLRDGFEKSLYSTYLSYLPEDGFAYPLDTHADNRGSFTEMLRTPDRGQVSVNVSKPGITKGNHWHHTKTEKFLVVSGQGLIRFRKIDADKILEYRVSGDALQVVDIPPGYTHSIVNVGESDLVTLMWANESFDPDHPDTYFMEV